MREEAVYAYRFEGKRYDCGSKLGYLQATVEYALGHPQLGRDFRRYLGSLDVSAAANGGAVRDAKRRAAGGNGAPRKRATGAAARRKSSAGTRTP
jgi:hypothetical protein